MSVSNEVFIIGVGQSAIVSPYKAPNWDYPSMVSDAVTAALSDCGLTYNEIQVALGAYVLGDSFFTQTALYKIGMTGIPIFNVTNGYASGDTAMFMLRQMIQAGSFNVGLVVGFDRMFPGPFSAQFSKATDGKILELAAFDRFCSTLERVTGGPMSREESPIERICNAVNFEHKKQNSQLNKADKAVEIPVPTCGAAAVILCSQSFLDHNPNPRAIAISHMTMKSEWADICDCNSATQLLGSKMVHQTVETLLKESKVRPEQIQFIRMGPLVHKPNVMETLGTVKAFIKSDPAHPPGTSGVLMACLLCSELRGSTLSGVALQVNSSPVGAAVGSLYQAQACRSLL